MNFKWMQLLLRAPEGEAGGATPPAPAAASGEPPANSPSGGDGSPTTQAEPQGNGSLLEGDAPADPAQADPAAKPPEGAEPLDLTKLTLPEGMKADDPGLAKLGEVLNNPDLKPNERAQALLDTFKGEATKVAEAAAAAVSDNYRQINQAWIAEVKSDPVIGGAKMQESMAVVAEALDRWGDGKALRKDLDLTGMGNNPHFLRFVHKMATELGEGRPAQGGTPASKKTASQILYGDSATPQA